MSFLYYSFYFLICCLKTKVQYAYKLTDLDQHPTKLGGWQKSKGESQHT